LSGCQRLEQKKWQIVSNLPFEFSATSL